MDGKYGCRPIELIYLNGYRFARFIRFRPLTLLTYDDLKVGFFITIISGLTQRS